MAQPRIGLALPSAIPAVSHEVYATDGAAVVRGDDPGDYYCEHVFYLAGRAARTSGIATNAAGEPLVGFLHVPGDAFTETTLTPTADRHAATRKIVGAALRGFIGNVPANEKAVRVLLTGFGPFETILNNPTGDFVLDRKNLDAAMRAAYGTSLRDGSLVATSARGQDVAYELPNGRRVIVRCVRLPVDDTTVDGRTSWSVQRLYKDFRPHAALHLGVAVGESAYRAEFHADNGGFAGDHHDDLAPPTNANDDNFALERVLGSAWAWEKTARAIIASMSASVRRLFQ